MQKKTIHYLVVDSPVGPLLLLSEGRALVQISFMGEDGRADVEPDWVVGAPVLERTARQLKEYFRGRRKIFDLPLTPRGTEFQLRVWEALKEIPYGVTISYGELARRIGRPKASRAVGAANGRNPLPIVIPCHRVVGGDGSLTGFGGGLEAKRRLLEIEGAIQGDGPLFTGL